MASIENIWLNKLYGARTEIRFDWDNDRHQASEIKGESALEVIRSLEYAIELLRKELLEGKI